MRRTARALALVAASLLATTAARAQATGSGLELFRQRQYADALPAFRRAVAAAPRDPDSLAWLAETFRRLDETDSSVVYARQALAAAPCHAFAHTVLADSYNPQVSGLAGANYDTTLAHLRAAVRCDQDEGMAWLSLWIQGLRTGDSAMERTALRRLVQSGFIPAVPLAYSRWVLASLPPRAVLMTFGDWDTYPAVALQLTEGLRTDVLVVNVSLLNLPWYARLEAARGALPLPFDSAGVENFAPVERQGGTTTLSDTVVGTWRAAAAAGRLGRPLTAAATTGEDFAARPPGKPLWSGPYAVIKADAGQLDTVAASRAIHAARGADFTGPNVSPRDRSPVRITSQPLSFNVVAVMSHYVSLLSETGAPNAQVRDAIAVERRFMRDAGIADRPELDETRGWIDRIEREHGGKTAGGGKP